MRMFAMVAIGCVVIGSWSAGSAARAQERTAAADDAAVREVVRKYVEAREQRDAKGVEALFTADADQLVSSGEWRRGRQDLVTGTLASSQRSGGTRTITIETVRVIAPGVAIADGRYEIAGLADGSKRQMWTTFVMTRTADGWRIAAIRNMLPAPPVPTAPANR
jgi:uncharacterized protein (TIGR02246 family)